MSRDLADQVRLGAGLGAVAAVTWTSLTWPGTVNATTAALGFLLVVLLVAATSRLLMAVVTSVAALLAFNYFFVPPVRTFSIADPQNYVALAVFLAVSLVASRLSTVARARTDEAVARQRELGRLFDLTRDILLMTDSADALPALVRSIARRFDREYVALGLPSNGWALVEAGPRAIPLEGPALAAVFGGLDERLEFDARARTYAGQRTLTVGEHAVHLVPLRLGLKPIGLLATAGPPIEPGTLDALAGVVAIAVERATLLEEREAAQVARRSEALKTALLASLGHDLRTPLTAIRVAAGNLHAANLTSAELREQGDLILDESERLTRTLEDILEMARIDAGAVESELRWVHPSEIITAARAQVERALGDRPVDLAIPDDVPVRVDPRLTAAALAHVLQNAAQYSPPGLPIDVSATVTAEGLTLRVRDRGPGVSAADLEHVFERFYRGRASQGGVPGTGMGLSIARGLLAVERGRIWAENVADGGAQFSILVPAASKASPVVAAV